MSIKDHTVVCTDDNIEEIRSRYPDGLTFVAGDTHGEVASLQALMQKIKFEPSKDRVFFVGDYNGGGNVQCLLDYISLYYEADYSRPGFHLIRGNHERELSPIYTLGNQPDIVVLKKEHMTYYVAHAGMVAEAFELINKDISNNPDKSLYVYKLDDICVQYDAPLRQLMWSRNGLYSQKSPRHVWPSQEKLSQNKACIIHGHSPYCFFIKDNYYSYGRNNLFWYNQRVFFSEDLQSFNVDSNIKGRYENGEGHRLLSCVCIEIIEEIAKENNSHLSMSAVRNAPNFVFSTPHIYTYYTEYNGDIKRITSSLPEMKTISLDNINKPIIVN